MEYNKLARQIHQDQKKAGWYDEFRSDNTLILLIKSELFEAFEAYRKNDDISSLVKIHLDRLLCMVKTKDSRFKNEFEKKVKDTFADELADIVIRLLDFAGYKELDLVLFNNYTKASTNVLRDLVNIDYCLGCLYDNDTITGSYAGWVIEQVEALAHFGKIDLDTHIKLKLAYNKTRGKRHGNKAV